MFGEGESESPRVPSPWDSLLSSPVGSPRRRSPSPSMVAAVLPKLVPENEEGNVEYKLQLLNPTPARFARLVTQLKWRLLEGGGQAYYELGVADSGELIGLERKELEQTLETLEMMAGEIGASVIVVKEVEIPASILDDAARRIVASGSATDVDSSTTEFEDEDSDSGFSLLNRTPSDTIFSMDNDLDDTPILLDVPRPTPPVPIDLEIAVVYKPRPFRRRESDDVVPGRRDRRHIKGKGKSKCKGKKHTQTSAMLSSALSTSSPASPVDGQAAASYNSNKEAKAHSRRQARDKRREERRMALLVCGQVAADIHTSKIAESLQETVVHEVTESLESFHVSTSPTLPAGTVKHSASMTSSVTIDIVAAGDDEEVDILSSSPLVVPRTLNGKDGHSRTSTSGARLIVEALVVRKLSLEEGFLDFEGFQIT